ncbi:hypothetical protein C8R45DRAFT_86817 [Mycena sanguinolenta]|nr:hypothetical protein C8R45DRAFT_86817 [Mycena sanguinolenta]
MESSIARPLLALTSSSSHTEASATAGTLVLLVGSSYLYFVPSVVPHYYWSPPSLGGAGNAPPPPHGALPPFDTPSSSSSTYECSPHELTALASASLSSFLAHDAPLATSFPAARTFYSLKTGRSPPKAYDAFWAFAQMRGGCWSICRRVEGLRSVLESGDGEEGMVFGEGEGNGKGARFRRTRHRSTPSTHHPLSPRAQAREPGDVL